MGIMNPNRGEYVGGEQTPETPPASGGDSSELSDNKVETSVTTPEVSPSKQPIQPVISIPQADVPDMSAISSQVQQDDQPTVPVPIAQGAGDEDRIPKPWIDRTKTVVAQNRDDPFTQKIEVSKVKAEYIKQRFNKVVKTDTGVS